MKKTLLPALLLIIVVFSLPSWSIQRPDIEVAFSPRSGATEAVVFAIREAKHSIRVAAYSFTSKDISTALIEAYTAGVDVQVVLDVSNDSGKYTAATFLANASVPVRINRKYTIMHNKFMVIDNNNVQTGSFNYTSAAENKNAENVLILRNRPEIAEQYSAKWQELWEEAEDYKAKY